jgi:multiple sugar transport system ATP-binding protein
VAIGRAIVNEPRVFLFDEPLSNLDAALRVQTRLEIAKLHHDLGSASMIYVTHDQVEAMTLADKIVLLHTGAAIEALGSVAQIGSPMALYHRPQSVFVAEFIGSPKMNLLNGRLLSASAGHALVEVAGQPVSVAVEAQHLAAGSTVRVGVRPEHLLVADEGPGAGLPASLLHTERLGDASLLYLALGDGQPTMTLRVEGSTVAPVGTRLTARLRPEQLHLFDGNGVACSRSVGLPT